MDCRILRFNMNGPSPIADACVNKGILEISMRIQPFPPEFAKMLEAIFQEDTGMAYERLMELETMRVFLKAQERMY